MGNVIDLDDYRKAKKLKEEIIDIYIGTNLSISEALLLSEEIDSIIELMHEEMLACSVTSLLEGISILAKIEEDDDLFISFENERPEHLEVALLILEEVSNFLANSLESANMEEDNIFIDFHLYELVHILSLVAASRDVSEELGDVNKSILLDALFNSLTEMITEYENEISKYKYCFKSEKEKLEYVRGIYED